MTDTTNTKDSTEPNAKPKAALSIANLDMRDYFAAKAMQSTFYPAILESIRIDADLDCGVVAGFAYKMADAMLKAREESNE